jgi:hypothetical protein
MEMPMPAATTKADLVAVTIKEWSKLQKLVSSVPEEVALRPLEDVTSM